MLVEHFLDTPEQTQGAPIQTEYTSNPSILHLHFFLARKRAFFARRSLRADSTRAATVAPAFSTILWSRIDRLSMKAPSRAAMKNNARSLARAGGRPAVPNLWAIAVVQLSKTAAVALRRSSLQLATSRANGFGDPYGAWADVDARVGARVPHFLALPMIVASSVLIATVPWRSGTHL